MSSLLLPDLKPALLKAVGDKARRQGQTTSEYVRTLIERDILADRTFDEILEPIRADVRAKGITEAELDEIVKRARKSGRRAAKGTR